MPVGDKDDMERCVLLGCDNPKQRTKVDGHKKGPRWEVISIFEKKSLAWRMGHLIEDEEHRMGNKKYAVMLVREADYDSGHYRPMKPPPGFDFALPEGEPIGPDDIKDGQNLMMSVADKVWKGTGPAVKVVKEKPLPPPPPVPLPNVDVEALQDLESGGDQDFE